MNTKQLSNLSKLVLIPVVSILSQNALATNLPDPSSDPVWPDETYENFHYDLETVLEKINSLRSQVQEDPEFAKDFYANPRLILENLGIPFDVQREILQEEGLLYKDPMSLEACNMTCACTRCCVTSVSV